MSWEALITIPRLWTRVSLNTDPASMYIPLTSILLSMMIDGGSI